MYISGPIYIFFNTSNIDLPQNPPDMHEVVWVMFLLSIYIYIYSCTADFSCSMKRTPQVVPPPSKAVQDQLSGVLQIHPTDTAIAAFPLPSWLGYGSPYPPLMLRKWKKPKVKPSMAPELVKALQDKDKPSCQQGGWNGEDCQDWNDSSVWSQDSTWNSWNSKEEWVQDERYQEKDMVEDSHTDANQRASFDDEYEYVIEEPETQPVFQRKPFMVEVGELRFSQLVPKWSASIAVGAGALGWEGELVGPIFAVNCLWGHRFR